MVGFSGLIGTKAVMGELIWNTAGSEGDSSLTVVLMGAELRGTSLRRAGWKAGSGLRILTGSSTSTFLTVDGVGLLSDPKKVKAGLRVVTGAGTSVVVTAGANLVVTTGANLVVTTGAGVVTTSGSGSETVVRGLAVTGLLLMADSLGRNLFSLLGSLNDLNLSLASGASSISLVSSSLILFCGRKRLIPFLLNKPLGLLVVVVVVVVVVVTLVVVVVGTVGKVSEEGMKLFTVGKNPKVVGARVDGTNSSRSKM